MDILHLDTFKNLAYINGNWVESSNQQSIEVFNPANNDLIATIPALAVEQIHEAIQAASDALQAWKMKSVKERSDLLKNWARLVLDYKDQLASIMTIEQGKPLNEAKGEISYAASFIDWFAEEGRRMYGDTIPAPTNDKRLKTIREPVGVCVAITPWNFPAAMITRKAAPALVAGCTMIVKPSEETPFSALALAYLAEKAGIPSGVLNVVTGHAQEIAPVLTASSIVKKVSFTGSTPIGALLMQQSASTLKKMSLELGGNAPLIVFDDADLDLAVQGTIDSKFRNAGQTCVCSNRIFVHESIHDAFVEKLKIKVSQLKLGNGLQEGVDLGPLINQKAVNKIVSHIDDAIDLGAELILGGQKSAIGTHFFEPTIVINANDEMLCFKEETFAPLAPIFKFKTDQEVIQRANNTEYGLASYIFTESLKRSIRVSEALEYGMVGINTGLISTTEAPFGGIKSSGFGREGSKYGLDEYTELKYICTGGL
ncbi:NAD-dependent succinate-semialdehyde dehydrogenase [Acinetobacter gyllenbergii]|uniref:Succinate-semialdehyde dehydrogenase (NADP+) n=1 Tax=Acinetobacter gyllenbergii CIP 110306 = MTCC 11365 TaxID=1217657 RepID=A0A829HBV1_9GAMM|nr:NAD-dependent succinate-semialdehyde dehydrogenase [Acinetobacter gyllenbergii]EPF70787.1 succinate-semialdehyde dehydrogenase (NADP+) [Acinetobacter gyllenbergii CIP 110306 = MTCC 11365]EPH30860.1 Succinate-semialdehyde dehydrogenase [Acinetobacter gyllenbergii CIP 110306 = MTCC 11365]GMA13592.1 NAD-dependent succinate-semialdehyde dehydrogenase [Acinetobacter gyllenbergii]